MMVTGVHGSLSPVQVLTFLLVLTNGFEFFPHEAATAAAHIQSSSVETATTCANSPQNDYTTMLQSAREDEGGT